MALIKYRDPVTGKLKVLTDNVNVDIETSGAYIGDDEPVDPSVRVWYDTSYMPTPRVKCKLDSGEWVEVAGGVGGGNGNVSTNNADFDVKNATGWLAKTISYGSDCNLAITWYSEEDGEPNDNGTIQISVNDVVKTSYEIEQSAKRFNEETGEEERVPIIIPIKKYLISGVNSITLRIEDCYGNPRVLKFKITTVQVSLSSSFDAGDDPASKKPQKGSIDFRYTPAGNVEKTVYFIIDGDDEKNRKVYTQTVTEDNTEKGFTIPEQTHGNHTFEVYFDCIIDGQPVRSNKLFYDIIWYEDNNPEAVVACAFKVDGDIKQYTNLNLLWRAYNTVSEDTEVTITDNYGFSTTRTVDRKEQKLAYRVDNIGTTEIYFSVNGVVKKTLKFNVVENKIDVSAQTEFLELYLDAKGRSNTDSKIDPKEWNYGSIKADLRNFNFNESDGWVTENGETFLRVKGNAEVSIPCRIFENDCKEKGKTIEFEFATRDVLNPNSPIIKCWSDEKGIMITAQEAMIKSLQNTLSRQYKENEHIRVSFVIHNDSTGHRLISLYINGVQSACVQYNTGETGDVFKQAHPVGITIGSKFCTTDIYCIRVYNTYLTREAVLKNWIADTQSIEEKIERYTRNNIFNSAGRIDYRAIASLNVPYLVVDAESYSVLPDKEDQEVIISGEYIDPLYPKRNFIFVNATITPQGTSSLRYARKNYKLKLEQNEDYPEKIFSMTVNGVSKDSYSLRDNSIPTNVFTFKADVASSEGANNVELVMLYDEVLPDEAKTPPQKINSSVRQGIEGYPCLMFYRDGSEYYFIGKYNFNNDKGTAEVFGLKKNKETGTFDQSWEIRLNNDKMAVWKEANFNPDDLYFDVEEGKDMPRWYKAFEPRFPKKNMDTTELEKFAKWLLSTDTEQATDKPFTELPEFIEKGIESVTLPFSVYLNKGGFYEFKEEENGVEYRVDNFNYRLAKFRHEFPKKANVDAMVFNYVFTEMFLMVDNRAKNAFPTQYDEDGLWLILPYDFDTAIGINNSGELKFGYWLEHEDGVFNDEEEGGSVLANNIRLAYSQEIKRTYQKLRENPAFSYRAVEERFANHQKVWGEAIFNEDSHFKYIEPLISEGRNDLPKLQGSKASQRQWWLYNRFRYFDSKYNTGDALNDIIFMYAYVKDDIFVKPYADIYATASFDSTLSSVRALRGEGDTPEEYRIPNPFKGETVESGKDHIITIYSASQLASIGDIYKLKIGGNADFHNGVKLNILLIGNYSDPTYENPNLENLSIGELKLLTKFDMSGCINYSKTVDLSGCSNLEEVYAVRTRTTAIALPNGGVLNTLHLPETITTLVVQNQPLLKNFSIGSYANVETLILEYVDFKDTFDIVSIIENLKTEATVTLTGFEYTFETGEEVLAFYDRFNKFTTTKPRLKGIIHCGSMTAEQFAEMKGRFYDIKIFCENVEATLTFQAEVRDEQVEVLTTRKTTLVTDSKGEALVGVRYRDPINDGTPQSITTPTRETNDTSKFIYDTWDNDLQNITGDTVVNAKFIEYRKYFVTFKDDKGRIIQVDGRDTNIYYDRIDENGVNEAIVKAPPEFTAETYYDEEKNGVMYQYWFNHWYNTATNEQNVKNVSGDTYNIEYKAYFSEYRVYVARFLDHNGNDVIPAQNLLEGDDIIEPTAPDWQSSNGQYNHEFKGWSEIGTNTNDENKVTVEKTMGTSDLTYYAVYNHITRSYTITFKGIYGGTDHRKEKILYQETLDWGTPIPVPTDTDVVGYTFKNQWLNEVDEVVTVDSNVLGGRTYIAEYKINTYTIRFINEGVVISNQKVNYDVLPVDPSKTEAPTKEANAQYTYAFDSWDKGAVVKATADVDYIATYSSTVNKYWITFYNEDGETEIGKFEVPYGTVPSCPIPDKTGYNFDTWVPLITAVTGTAEYKIKYTPIIYTITWEFGIHSDVTQCPYDEVPDIPSQYAVGKTYSIGGFTYSFLGWEQPTVVRGDATYKALVSGSGTLSSRFSKLGYHGGGRSIGSGPSASDFQAFKNGVGSARSDSSNSTSILYGFDFRKLALFNNVEVTEVRASITGRAIQAYSYTDVDVSSKRCYLYTLTDFSTKEEYSNSTSLDTAKSKGTLINSNAYKFEDIIADKTNTKTYTKVLSDKSWINSNLSKVINGYDSGTFGLILYLLYCQVNSVDIALDFTFG